jgi:hypothetical protein
MRRIAVALVLLLLPLALLGEEALTNNDVIKMVQAGLADEVVAGKVKEAPRVAFHLEVDDLLALREAGVSQAVIGAMLERNKPAAPPPAPAMPANLGMEVVSVSLKGVEGETPVSLIRGDMSSAGFGPYRNMFMNYPGLKARARTHDRHPVLLVHSDTAITGGRYFLAKLDPDDDDGVRSLKISSVGNRFKAAFGSDRGVMAPDPDWTVPFDAVEESPGLWRVTVKKDLPPGEYGWYVNFGAGVQGAGLFDFGVD